MPRRSDAGTAILEPAPRSPAELAAEATAKAESLREQSLLADWTTWREIVASIASGREPTGKQLAEIATLAERLRLPPGALADAVRAVSRERELESEISGCRRRIADARSQAPELKAEIEKAEQRVRELKAELHAGHLATMTEADVTRSLAEHRHANPLVFRDVAELVSQSIQSNLTTGRPT